MSGPGGCLGDIGTHAANLAEYVTGLTINKVCADVSSIVPGRKLDDDVSVLLRFKGGARGVLLASQISAGEDNDLYIRVYGEKGGLEWNHADPNTLLLRWLNEPTRILRAGTNYTYLSEKTRMNCRTPGGHPEGYIEAFANIYRNVAWHKQHLEKKETGLPEYIDYPGIVEGVRGMRFVEKVLASGKSQTKWIDI
jgi:predicted dehydrogenase